MKSYCVPPVSKGCALFAFHVSWSVCPMLIASWYVNVFPVLEAKPESTFGMSSPVALVWVAIRLLPMKRTLALAVTSWDERVVCSVDAPPQEQRMQSRTGAAVRARSFIRSPGRGLWDKPPARMTKFHESARGVHPWSTLCASGTHHRLRGLC